jgi:hypothetical protein
MVYTCAVANQMCFTDQEGYSIPQLLLLRATVQFDLPSHLNRKRILNTIQRDGRIP